MPDFVYLYKIGIKKLSVDNTKFRFCLFSKKYEQSSVWPRFQLKIDL